MLNRARLTMIFGALLLSACAAEPTLLPPEAGGPVVASETIYFATTRARSGTQTGFTSARADEMTFGAIEIGIPPSHTPGQVETTDGVPDPARHFHQREFGLYPNGSTMLTEAVAEEGGMFIFVHGYNTSFTESIFRLAQIRHDTGLPGAGIAFTWPSLGQGRGYLYDRDSALAARDDLAALLAQAVRQSDGQLRLGAHSMGSFLVMEALTRLGLDDDQRTLSGISEVILISPDIDIDLFRNQLRDAGYPPEKIGIVVNRNDRLLDISNRISGSQGRLGAQPDPDALRALGVQVFDVTGLDDGDTPGHFLPATSPTLLAAISAGPGLDAP